jgi:hypothetical protein
LPLGVRSSIGNLVSSLCLPAHPCTATNPGNLGEQPEEVVMGCSSASAKPTAEQRSAAH